MQVAGNRVPGYNSITVKRRNMGLDRQLVILASGSKTFTVNSIFMCSESRGEMENNQVLMNYGKHQEGRIYGIVRA